MKSIVSEYLRRHPVLSTLILGVAFGVFVLIHSYTKAEDRIPVSIIGAQHLGYGYEIDEFYVDQGYFGDVGEGGSGGGGIVCCVTLPRKWREGLKVDVRWKVSHVVRSLDEKRVETAKIEGMYHAIVPVEQYIKTGDLFVHFFSGGQVRVVVSEFSADSEQHPIQISDSRAGKNAAVGISVKALFSPEEIAESEREVAREKAKYGDWR